MKIEDVTLGQFVMLKIRRHFGFDHMADHGMKGHVIRLENDSVTVNTETGVKCTYPASQLVPYDVQRNGVTLVVDCNYIAYQAFFTLGELSKKDIPTGVIFGFLSRILHLGMLFKTNNIIFCWDSKHSKRKEIFKQYKANRTKDMSEDDLARRKIMFEQFKTLRKEVLPEMGFGNVYCKKGYEADDLIAQFIKDNHHRCASEDDRFYIISADEDLFQLIQEGVSMYRLSKKIMTTWQSFKKEYGIHPLGWWRVKTIAGCRTDKVPGVPGVGEKTAIKYLLKKLKKNSSAYQKIKSEETRELEKRNARLVVLPFDGLMPIYQKSNCFNPTAFKRICKRYGFRSFAKDPKWLDFFNGKFSKLQDIKEALNK